jgi:hypothetical protein
MPIFNGGRIGSNNVPFTGTKSDDPNYSSVSLLLNGNGTNGSTTFTDSSSYGHTVTPGGNAQISTAQSKFGGASMYFDGSGDYINCPASTAFSFGTGDFTIEFFARWNSFSNVNVIIDTRSGGSSANGLAIYTDVNGTIVVYSGFTTFITGSALQVNQWYFVALSRASGTTRLFIDGVQSGALASDTRNYTDQNFFAGRTNESAINYFSGYIDDLRVTKGIARYTSNFTPPAAQLPGRETGTFASGLWTGLEQCDAVRREIWTGLVPSIVTDGLVVHLDAGNSASYPGSGTTWTDLSGNGNNATLFGTPSYTASPGYFDITSDSTYARLSSYSHLTNDFTYSMWVRFDAFGSYDTLIENGSWTDVGPLFRVQSTTSIAVYTENALRGTFTWSPSTNTWYNVVYTRSGSTNILYVNGTQSGSTFTDQTNISLSNAYTFLMRSQHTTGQFTNGQLAQYAMYNKALTASEITQNFDTLKGRYGL